jgi:hypothetical protein
MVTGQQQFRWWQSSERAKELLIESAGYLYEVLFNSGRSSNTPFDDFSGESSQHACLKIRCLWPAADMVILAHFDGFSGVGS